MTTKKIWLAAMVCTLVGTTPSMAAAASEYTVENKIRVEGEQGWVRPEGELQTLAEEGMIDMNRSLAELARVGEITVENAYLNSLNPKNLERMI